MAHTLPFPVSTSAYALACALGCALAFAVDAHADPVSSADVVDRTEAKPDRLQGVDVDEHLGASLPENLEFTTAEGNPVQLGALIHSDRPTLLTFNYSNCPMLCSLQLNGLVDGLRQIERRVGKDFDLVTVSLDPAEDPERLRAMKARYVDQYAAGAAADLSRDTTRQGWHFLRGSEQNVQAVAKAVGFNYGYNEERGEYMHPAAVMLLTPSGKVARYLYGIEYHPRTLSLSVVEVSEGKIGGSMDQLLLYCFHYDETEGRYAPVAMNIMRLGGGLTAIALGSVLAGLWWRESRRGRVSVTV